MTELTVERALEILAEARTRDPLRWRLWWRLGFTPICRLIGLLPISEWRKEAWITPIDFWAMDHIGRRKVSK